MNNRKTIGFSYNLTPDGVQHHHFRMEFPEVCKKFGLSIFFGINNRAPVNGFYSAPWRKFYFYSFSLLCSGRGKLQFRDSAEQTVEPGDLVMITPEVEHRYGGAFDQDYQEETLLFCGETADHLRDAGVLCSGLYHGGAAGLFQDIIHYFSEPTDSGQIRANLLLLRMIGELYEQKKNAPDSSSIDKVLRLLQRHPEKWWTVQELCEASGYSMNQFRLLFTRKTGMSPKNYIEALKLRQAAHLLLSHPNLSIAKIGRQLGYLDEYHFSRRFKMFFSVPPRLYRKQCTPAV